MMSPDPSKTNILLVDDDPSSIQVLSKALTGLGRIRFATSGADALRLALEVPPDLVLLDAEMPGMNGFQVCQAMKSEPVLANIPVIFVTGHSEESMEESGLALGAVDFIAKPIRPAIVVARVKTHLRLKHASDVLLQLANTDGLTGIANRRSLDQVLIREWLRSRRLQSPLSVLMLDIDYFKLYNDTYGHLKGDETLISIAKAIQACMSRPCDLVARYGGEEFVAVLPDTGLTGALNIASTIMEKIKALALPHTATDKGYVTVSIGIACFNGKHILSSEGVLTKAESQTLNEIQSVAELLSVADQALYQAKDAGRASIAVGKSLKPVVQEQ
ncbi:diguanylate cyclase [Leeia oryzae]|uniref:diguanylate cyclase n=1 Tax=Leeia oryzae TaxID=356662 RepID=UPI0003636F8D|nr:diguanylate cyclase [Leeia oryzae]